MLFVDIKQAFDSIDRYKLYQVIEDMKIPYKLTTLVKMTMKNTTARVKVTNTLSNSFTFNPYPTAFPYGNGMVLHFYQQQESSTTKTVHKVINKGLKTYVLSLHTGENFH